MRPALFASANFPTPEVVIKTPDPNLLYLIKFYLDEEYNYTASKK